MPGRGLNLLSLDGGGIRGLSSLQVLKNILEKVAHERGLSEPPKPCDFFDMIGGTSTGGIIAIMLGRMKMSVDDCIEAYTKLSDQVFRKTHFSPFKLTGKIRGRFDSQALGDAVKKYLRECSLSEDCLLQDVDPTSCRVFVCATSGSTRKTVVLSSYATRRTNTDRLKYTKVWQAARATSAASGFFDAVDVQFGSYKESYTDGATGANNPIYVLWQEAKEAFLQPGEQLGDHVDCVLSIGTGIPAIEPFGSDLKSIAKSIIAISTETEETAKNFRRNHEYLKEAGRYFRFNVAHGLERIGLERTDRKNDIINITNHYLEEDETYELLKKCANAMKEHDGEARSDFRGIDTIVLRSHRGIDFRSRSTTSATNDWSLSRRGINEFLDSISVYDHDTRLKSISTRVIPGTTRWILSNDVFVSWEADKDYTFLLCTGIVGSGKTMLASSAVEELVRIHDGPGEVVAHYFLDANYPEELSTTEILRGIIRQVVSELKATSCAPEWLANMLRKYFGSKHSRHGGFVLCDILQQLLCVLECSIIIIDGLHEVSEHEASLLLGIIRQFSTTPKLSGKVKFAVFTREEIGRSVSITTALPNVMHLRLTMQLLEDDISFFIDERIRQKTTYEHILTENEHLMEDVRSTIGQNGEKMFLWIELQLKTTWDTCFNDEEIRKALNGLPQGIEETYMRCLRRISQDPRTINYGYSIMHLIAYVQRPLAQAELREAVSVPRMSDHFEEDKLVNGHLPPFCANLVEQDHLTATFRFVHPSVKTFLEQYFFPARNIPSSLVTGKAYPTDTNFKTVGVEHCRDICFKYISMKDFGSEIAPHSTVKTSVDKSTVVDRALNIGNKGMRLAIRACRLLANGRFQQIGDSHMVLETRRQTPQDLQDDRSSVREYHLLKYIQDHWPSHTHELTPIDPAWPTFVALVNRVSSTSRTNPWISSNTNSIITRQPLLIYAVLENHLPLLRVLQEQLNPKQMVKLIELPIKDDSERAIHLATSREVIVWLIRFGGTRQLAFRSIGGNTLLHLSAANGNTEILKEVLGDPSAATLLYTRNTCGETPITIAIMGGWDCYLDRAMQAIQQQIEMTPREKEDLEECYAIALEIILKARPNFNNRLSVVGSHIRTLVKGLLELGHAVYWFHWINLAMEDDLFVFFDCFLRHPDSWDKIADTIKNAPSKHARRDSILTQACTISATTKIDRVRILELLLVCLPEEISWTVTRAPKNSITKNQQFWPLSLAMSQVKVYSVAVDIVRVLAAYLLKLSIQGKYVPEMIEEFDRVPDTEVGYTEILSLIDPQSVKDLLISGALTLNPSRFVPRTILFHVAAMKEDPALIMAISSYILSSKPDSLVHWLASKSNASESALSLAFVGNRPRHVLCVMTMIDTFLNPEHELWNDMYEKKQMSKEEVQEIFIDYFRNLSYAIKNGKIQTAEKEGVGKMAAKLTRKIRCTKVYFELIAGVYLPELSVVITKDELERLELLSEQNESPPQLNASESGSAQLQHPTILETFPYSDSHSKNLDDPSHGYSLRTSVSEESVYLSANEESFADAD